MTDKKELKEEQLNQVSGGDDMVDAAKSTIQDQEEERLKQLLEDVENNRNARISDELSDTINNMIDILSDLTGSNGSGKIVQ